MIRAAYAPPSPVVQAPRPPSDTRSRTCRDPVRQRLLAPSGFVNRDEEQGRVGRESTEWDEGRSRPVCLALADPRHPGSTRSGSRFVRRPEAAVSGTAQGRRLIVILDDARYGAAFIAAAQDALTTRGTL